MYGIFTYTWLISMVNVGEYIPYMDPMDMILLWNLAIPFAGFGFVFIKCFMDQIQIWQTCRQNAHAEHAEHSPSVIPPEAMNAVV